MNGRVFLTLAATAFLSPGLAGAQEKKPVGTWTRTDGKTTVTLKVSGDTLSVLVRSEKLKLDCDSDFGLSGKATIYSCIRKVREGDENLAGGVFAFDYELQGELLVLSKFRASGALALGGFFMNGNYRKEGARKD
jgi:hypothetical protein